MCSSSSLFTCYRLTYVVHTHIIVITGINKM